MLIGIAGKAGSGKDEVTGYLSKAFGFSQLTFAEPIKDALQIMFDMDIHTLEKMGFKENPIPGIGVSLRELYQTLGTDWAREKIDKDIWVKQLATRLQAYPGSNVIVSDVRFENEAEFIRANGGHIIHIQRDNAETVREHVSETGVKFISGKDLLINNNGSRNALYDKAAQTLQVIKDEHHKIKAA